MEYLIGIIVLLLGAVGFMFKKGQVRESLLNYLTSNKDLSNLSTKSDQIQSNIDSEDKTQDEIKKKLNETATQENINSIVDFLNNRKR